MLKYLVLDGSLRSYTDRFRLSHTAGGDAGGGAGGGGSAGAGGGGGSGSSSGTGAATGAGAGAGSGTGSAATGTGVQPGSPSGTGGDGTSPSSGQSVTPGAAQPGSNNGNDQNLAVIRQSHELVNRLGGPQQVQTAIERYNGMQGTAWKLAERLGYTRDSFDEAFTEGPYEVYEHLAKEFKEASRTNGQAGDQNINALLDQRLTPVNQVLSRYMARDANNLVDGEFTREFSDHTLFKGKQVPEDVKAFVNEIFTDSVREDQKTMQGLLKGDASGLKPHFEKAVAAAVKFANAWGKWNGGGNNTNAGTGTGTGQSNGDGAQRGNGTPNPNPFSLDDIINGDDKAVAGLPSMRNFR